MKRSLSSVLVLSLLLLSACHAEQEQIYSHAMEKSTVATASSVSEGAVAGEEKSLRGRLTVSTCVYDKDSSLVLLAEKFCGLHPDVDITFDYEFALEEMSLSQNEIDSRWDAYELRLRTALVSGEGPDIISGSGGLDLYSMAKSGVLADFHTLWQDGPGFQEEDYFAHVLQAYEVEGKLCTLPFSFSPDVVYLNKRVTDILQLDLAGRMAVNCDELLDWYNQALGQGILSADCPLTFTWTGNGDKSLFFKQERCRYMDIESRTASFSKGDFTSHLEKTMALPSPQLDNEGQRLLMYSTPVTVNELLRCRATGEETYLSPDGYGRAYEYVQTGREAFMVQGSLQDFTLREMVSPAFDYLEGPFLLVSTNNILPLISSDDLAVPAASQQKELAWEFIKYCVGEQDSLQFENGQSYTNGIPIHKKNAEAIVKNSGHAWQGDPSFTGLEEWLTAPVDGGEAVDKMEEMLASVELVNGRLYSMEGSGEILAEYYENGLSTAQQCAEKLQGRAYIWLNE